MQQQCSHGVRFPVVNEIMVDNRMIPIFCAGDYAQAKGRLFRYAQAARAAVTGRRDCGAASAFGGDTVDAGNGVTDFGGDGFDGVGVMA
jgi:hypothetical protein